MKYFCFHNYTKWGNILEDYGGKRCQYRKCKKCNKVVKRERFWNNSITSEEIMKSMKDK